VGRCGRTYEYALDKAGAVGTAWLGCACRLETQRESVEGKVESAEND
jgi:hypothetical protein